ncbi:MAG: molybdopterin dinucleotide-binding protein [Deltaproteobacteria bacterium]|nr:molybdopterin dinucleotide-binding protein [Deltaproteobacteria bacterium]
MSRTHLRTCPLCEAMCGLEITVEGDRVTGIRPDDDDVWSRGYVCPKGAVLGDLHHDPDRLRAPLVRDGDTWRQVSWAEAFAEVAKRLHPVIQQHGMESVTAYIGNPTAHNFSLSRYVGAFMGMSTIPSIYSAGTVDQWPKNLVGALVYGGMWTIPVPDLDRTDYLLVLGANPSASQGSLLAAADVLGRLDAIRARGGKVVVVDPRRTGTVAHADEWLPIRPGTDAAFLAAIVQVLFEEKRADLGRLAGIVAGIERVEELCPPFTPEAVAETCAIPAETIRRLARELAEAPTAAVYGRIGTCNQEFGTLASWLVEVVNVISGNLDRPGGSMFSNPIAWSMTTLHPPDQPPGFEMHRWRSRVRGAPEVLGQVPLSCLAEEIATPGKGQIRALIAIAGNPVISAPDASRLEEALPLLDCMISVDNYLNETSRHADVILPGLSALEQPHYDELIWAWSVRNAGKFSEAIFPPPADRPAEWEILLQLAAIVAGAKYGDVDTATLDDLYFGGIVGVYLADPRSSLHGRDAGEIVAATEGRGPERLLDFAIRCGPWGDLYGKRPGGLTLARLREQPHGVDMGPLEPRVEEMVRTPSGKIELAPEYITADLVRLRERLSRKDEGLVLVSRRHLRSNNSWMHNVEKLVRGRERCTLLIHPEDASRCRIEDGARALIRSPAGTVEAPVQVSDEMMPGVVSLPHGWGHDLAGTRLGVAQRYAGVNNNILAPGYLVDVPSGNAVVNGIPVEVTPV